MTEITIKSMTPPVPVYVDERGRPHCPCGCGPMERAGDAWACPGRLDLGAFLRERLGDLIERLL